MSTQHAHDRGRRTTGETPPAGSRTETDRAGSSQTRSGRAGATLAVSRKPSRGHIRRPPARGLIVLGVLLVIGFGLATAYLVTRAGDRVSVLAIRDPIAKGQTIESADLVSQAVSGVPGALAVADVEVVVGKTATVDLLAGQVLSGAMVTSAATPAEGQASVGLALDPTRVPSAGLAPGDVVDVIAVPGGESADATGRSLNRPTVLARVALVFAVQGAATGAGQVLLTLVVQESEATPVAAYSTSGRVAVVEVAATATATVTAPEGD